MRRSDDRKAVVSRVNVQKSYDALASQLRSTILDGSLAVGDRLPSERELVDQTGLSRGSVREALRMLEVEGLVQSRPGRNGGITVTRPDKQYMARFVSQYVRSRRMPARTIYETRETIEPALARFAALNRSEDELDAIVRLNEQLADPTLSKTEFARINALWHGAVAAASHNELLAALLYAMSHGVLAATTAETFDSEDIRRAVYKAHARVIEAIAEGDGDAAFRRMERHLLATRAEAGAGGDDELSLDPPTEQ